MSNIRKDIKAKLILDIEHTIYATVPTADPEIVLDLCYPYLEGAPELEDVNKFPAISITSLGEQIKYNSEGSKQHTARYLLIAYLKVPELGDFETLAEDTFEDISDRFSGATYVDSLPLESFTIDSFEPYSDATGKGFIVVPLTIIYND